MDVIRSWRRWIRPAAFTLYFIALMIALPLCIIELNRKGAPDHVQAWFIAGLFVMMALPISFWGIIQHLIYYTQPDLQRHIIRILWMVPIYALNAWFALRFPAAAIYLDTLRECYEAYVIYNFMRYLINFLHQEHPRLDLMLEDKPRVKHFIPFCCLPPWPPGKIFLNRCKHGVLQYTVVRPAMTIVALISQLAGKYDEGNFNFTSTWSYIVIINNVSQIWAMYCLVLFYKATKEELAPIRPVPKFLCVKAVVFVSFWQSTVIAALAKLNVIPAGGTWVFYHNVEEVATGLQDFIICLEMFIAAVAHYWSFSHLPFADDAARRDNCLTTFWSMWDVRDVRDDVMDHARYIGRGVQKKFSSSRLSQSASSSERTPLLLSQDSSNAPNSSSSVNAPSTPPVLVEESPQFAGTYDAQSLSEAEWEKSTETFHVKSTTPSMVNYAEFSTSVEVHPPGTETADGFSSLEGTQASAVGSSSSSADRNSKEAPKIDSSVSKTGIDTASAEAPSLIDLDNSTVVEHSVKATQDFAEESSSLGDKDALTVENPSLVHLDSSPVEPHPQSEKDSSGVQFYVQQGDGGGGEGEEGKACDVSHQRQTEGAAGEGGADGGREETAGGQSEGEPRIKDSSVIV